MAAVVAAVLGGAQEGPAFAEAVGGRRVVVLTLPGAQASRDRAEEVALPLVGALGADAVGPEEARRGLGRRVGVAATRERRRLTVRARQELEAFEDLDRAASLLDRAAAAHVEVLPLVDSLQEPLRLFTEAATVRLAMGDSEGTSRALREAARLDPDLDLDPTEVPRRLAAAAAEARQGAADAPILAVATAEDFAAELEARLLVVVQPRPGPRRVVVELYVGETGERVGRWVVVDDDVAAARRGLVAAISEPSPLEPGPEVPPDAGEGEESGGGEPPPPPPPPVPWHHRWWVWTLVAVVVAGIAVGATLAVVDAQDQPDVGLEVSRRW